MPLGEGYALSWGMPVFHQPYLAGSPVVVIEPGMKWPGANATTSTQMENSSWRLQVTVSGTTAPSDLSAQEWTVPILTASQEAAALVRRACVAGVVDWFPEWPILDVWAVLPGVVLLSASRRVPYGLIPGVTLASHPPVVTIDGVEQTLVPSGPPGAGEVVVGTGQYQVLQIPSATSPGAIVTAWWPLVYEVLATVESEVGQFNDASQVVKLVERSRSSF